MGEDSRHGLGDDYEAFFRPDVPASRPRRAIPPSEQDSTFGSLNQADVPTAQMPTVSRAIPSRALLDEEDQPAVEPAAVPDAEPAPATAVPASRWHHPFTKALGLTALGTLLPGLGFIGSKFKWIGVAILVAFLAGTGSIAWWVADDPFRAAKMGTRPVLLRLISFMLIAGAAFWVFLIAAQHLVARPKRLSSLQRGVGAVVVSLLAFSVSAPLAVAARYSWDQANLVQKIFGVNNKKKSMTRPTLDTGKDSDSFWKDKPRLNILLVGLDDSAKRNYGSMTSTDTMMVASIDTLTGNMVLTQIPRNMASMPFPEGSPLAQAYPDGFTDGNPDSAEYMANAVWSNVPQEHPELFENSDFKGADALKLGMEGTLGIKIDYFMALNIDGLTGLINAMGGVRLNVNERIPIAGSTEGKAPKGYIEPGPDQKLNGYNAMWYARSRSESSDYDRMGRQSCVVKAVIQQADPQTLATRYESIAKASGTAVSTDIPSDVLPHLVDLSERIKDGKLDRVLFVHGEHGYSTRYPDFQMMKNRVIEAIEKQGGSVPGITPSADPSSPSTDQPASSAAPTTVAPSSLTPTPTPTQTTEGEDPEATGTPGEKPESKAIENLNDVCAYNPK